MQSDGRSRHSWRSKSMRLPIAYEVSALVRARNWPIATASLPAIRARNRPGMAMAATIPMNAISTSTNTTHDDHGRRASTRPWRQPRSPLLLGRHGLDGPVREEQLDARLR